MNNLILSLCDHSSNWSRPYAEAGYDVLKIDLQSGSDVRLMGYLNQPVHGILAAPPCDHFALSGARWWASKGEGALLDGLAIVDACLRAVAIYRPEWWALENPKGRLSKFLGPPAWAFDPCEFGDPWTKRTQLWGHFTPPKPLWSGGNLAVKPVKSCSQGSWMQQLSGQNKQTKNLRSATPEGFARAFFEANP